MAIFEFPGTNFHDLNLDWLLNEMKKCLEEWETVKGQFTSLQEYVANYFANLDVSDEISAKLDEMAESGELLKIASALIQSTTTEYLASVITNPNSPPLDRSLSLATAAAPADMVGVIKDLSMKYYHVSQETAETEFENMAANLPVNTYCWVSYTWFNDIPYTYTGWIFTITNRPGTTYATQVLYTPYTGKTFSRIKMEVDGEWVWGEFRENVIQTELEDLEDDVAAHYLHYSHITQTIATNTYNNLAANLPGNTYSWVNGAWFNDLPVTDSVFIITLADRSAATFAGQLIYNPDKGIIYTRHKYSTGTYGAWIADGFQYRNVLTVGADFDTIVDNSIYGVSSSTNYINRPPLSGAGYLFTIAYGYGYVTQIVFSMSGDRVYSRNKTDAGVWGDWADGYHDPSAKYFAFGDSTTYGQIGGTGGQSKYNYPACIGRVLGLTTVNKGVGGQGLIKDWATIHTNYITNLDMTGAKLITIGWAYNDHAYYPTLPFGAYTDTDDSTVIGKYYTIMKEFQQKCPTAVIVLITGYGKPDGQVGPPVVKPTLTTQFTGTYTFSDGTHTAKELYDTLEAMCNLHGWHCVNQSKGTVLNQWNASTLIGDQIHPTNEGYLVYGNFLAAHISAIYANIRAF